MSSPAGASVPDQLARWGFTCKMQSFASQLQVACWHVTHKFANPRLTSCTSTWSPLTSEHGQAQEALLRLPQIPQAGRLQSGVAYEVPAMDATLLPRLQALSKACLEISTVVPSPQGLCRCLGAAE